MGGLGLGVMGLGSNNPRRYDALPPSGGSASFLDKERDLSLDSVSFQNSQLLLFYSLVYGVYF